MTNFFANGFSTIPGRCFRFVTDGVGAQTVCGQPVVVSGSWRDDTGRLWLVQACTLHVGNLNEIEMAGETFVPYNGANDEAAANR